MRLTLHTDFALRVLIHVGINDGRLTTTRDIAAGFGISKNHLTKVVNDLGRRGYLKTVRGRNGGIRLMCEPCDINIGRIVRETEDELARIIQRGAVRSSDTAGRGVIFRGVGDAVIGV